MIISEFHYLNDRQNDMLPDRIGQNAKYKLITLLMMDAGLRVSEAAGLRFGIVESIWVNLILGIPNAVVLKNLLFKC